MKTEIRFLLAILLMVGVLVATNLLFPPTPVQPPPAGSEDGVSTTAPAPPRDVATIGPADSAAPGAGAVSDGAAPATAASDSAAAPAVEPERTVVVEGPLFRHAFSTRGARLVSAELLSFQSFTRDGPVQLVPEEDGGALGLRLVVGADTIDLRDAPFTPSAEGLTLAPGETGTLAFRHERPGLTAEVAYRFGADGYVIDVAGTVAGADRALVIVDMGSGIPFNEHDESQEISSVAYVGNHLQDGIESHPVDEVDEPVVIDGPFVWSAFKSKFFVFALLPGTGEGEEYFGGMLVRPAPGDYRAAVAVTEALEPGGTFAHRAFVGPQDYARLTALGSDLEEVNPYGWRFFRPIVRPFVSIITAVLVFLHNTLSLGYGWVLVVFGVLMRLLLWPFNQKAMRAQMRNMAVQPMLKEIQTKYKDKPEKMQQEMMKLYKEYGFNPLAGCLPMLLPWPVLIALFFVFQNTIEFRGVPFLWLPDLSSPDPLYILPVFMGVSMFFLQWISMRSMTESNPQMKMMMWMMPIMMVFIFFNLAAGLNLYYSVSNLATIPQQYWIAKERVKAQAAGPVRIKPS